MTSKYFSTLAFLALLAFLNHNQALSEPEFKSKIIHGEQCHSRQHPASLAIIMTGEKSGICGGTLIAPDVVLTAAHCIKDNNTSYMVTNEHDLTNIDLSLIRGIWSSTTMTPKSYLTSKTDDIGLMILSRPVTSITPAKLIDPETAKLLKKGDDVQIVGWGLQHPMPKQINDRRIKSCAHSFIQYLERTQFQVGSHKYTPRKCFGDSGSATYFEHPYTKELLVIGVTAHSAPGDLDCLQGGMDTRVDAYLDWIKYALGKACQEGLRNQVFCR